MAWVSAVLLSSRLSSRNLKPEAATRSDLHGRLRADAFPITRAFDITAESVTLGSVGGDYYDFAGISRTQLVLILADVSGNGIKAAQHAVKMKRIFHGIMSDFGGLTDAVTRANEAVMKTFERGTFLSAVMLLLDAESGHASMIRCGHCFPLHWERTSRAVRVLSPPGLGLGIASKESGSLNQEHVFSIGEGDCLLLYTDGLTEARDPLKGEYGLDRLIDSFGQKAEMPTQALVSGLLAQAHEFGGNPADDMTVLAIRRKTTSV